MTEHEMPLTPSFLLVTAGAFVGVKEEGGDDRGQMVARFLAMVGLKPGNPWGAAFVSYVGYWSHYDHRANRSVWPLPLTANCWELGHFAWVTNILEQAPHRGDVFLLHDPDPKRKHFAHTGIVVEVLGAEQRPNGDVWYECTTIEGDTNDEGSRDGDGVARRSRMFYPEAGDRFIRWVKLDRRGKPQEPGGQSWMVA